MKYICMNCGKIYEDKYLPSYGNADGCCSIGSLIEMETQGIRDQLENTNIKYYDNITEEDIRKYLKDLYDESTD